MRTPTPDEFIRMSWHARQKALTRMRRETTPRPTVVLHVVREKPQPVARPEWSDEEWAERERERARQMEAQREADPQGRVRLHECYAAIYGRRA